MAWSSVNKKVRSQHLCPVCCDRSVSHGIVSPQSAQGDPGSALSLASDISQPLREGSATFTLLPNSEPHSQMLATNFPCQGQVYNLTASINMWVCCSNHRINVNRSSYLFKLHWTFTHENPWFYTQCTNNVRSCLKCKKKWEAKLEGLRISIKKLPQRDLPTAASNPYLGNCSCCGFRVRLSFVPMHFPHCSRLNAKSWEKSRQMITLCVGDYTTSVLKLRSAHEKFCTVAR